MTTNPSEAAPDVRPLGALAVSMSLLCLGLALTYLLSPLAYLVAVIAVPLGIAARSNELTRRPGNVALVIAVLGVLVAMVMTTSIWMD